MAGVLKTFEDRAVWISSDYLDLRIFFFQVTARSRDRSTGPDTRDKVRDLALRIFPNFRSGCPVMSFGICRVIVLVRVKRVRRLLSYASRRFDVMIGCAVLRSRWTDNDIGPEGFQVTHLFDRDFVGQDE